MSAVHPRQVRPFMTGLTACTLVLASIATAGSASAAGTARPVIRVNVTSAHKVVAPASARPGLVHLVNSGTHEIIVVRKKAKGVAGFVADDNGASSTAGSIRFYKDFDVVDLVAAHANEYVRLAKGTYYLADADVQKVTASLVHALTVSGTVVSATAPRSTAVQAAANGHVAGKVALAQRSYAHVVNKAASPHIISIASIKSGVTTKQIDAVIADPKHHSYTKVIGSYFAPLGLIAAHTDLYKLVTAKPGRYLLFAASLTHPGLAKGQIGLLTIK